MERARWRSRVTGADRTWWARAPREGAFEAVWTPALFRLAHERLGAERARGEDGLGTASYAPATLERICAASRADWCPRPLRLVRLPDREVGIPDCDDQLVVAAWNLVATPRLESRLPRHVHGFRRGRSPRSAVAALARATVPTAGSLVRADIRRMFESLDHAHVLEAVDAAWPGAGLGRAVVERALACWSPGFGVPTGVALSPTLSNAALRSVDIVIEALLREGRAVAAVRYADDFALLVPSAPEGVIHEISSACLRIGLLLHPGKTRTARLADGSAWPVRVLGYDMAPRPDGRGIVALPQTPRGSRFSAFFR